MKRKTPVKPRRVAVYGMPRSGTSVMLGLLCQRFRLNNFGEVFNAEVTDVVPSGPDMVPWLRDREPWGIKFLTNAAGPLLLDYLRALDVQWLVVMHRDNLTDCCLSGHFAHVLDTWHHNRPVPVDRIKPRPVSTDHVIWWLRHVYVPYLSEIQQLKDLDIPQRHYTKEHVENNGTLEVADTYFSTAEFRGRTVASEIDYRAWCTNYDDIAAMIRDYQQHV